MKDSDIEEKAIKDPYFRQVENKERQRQSQCLSGQAYQNITMENKNDKQVWVINTFSVQPDKAEVVASLQLELVEKVKIGWPGFISQQTLIAKDGNTVTTVEVWENFETLKAIAEHESLIEYRKKIQQHATLSPVLYTLAGESKNSN